MPDQTIARLRDGEASATKARQPHRDDLTEALRRLNALRAGGPLFAGIVTDSLSDEAVEDLFDNMPV